MPSKAIMKLQWMFSLGRILCILQKHQAGIQSVSGVLQGSVLFNILIHLDTGFGGILFAGNIKLRGAVDSFEGRETLQRD